jgi:hypothetical protein
MKHHETTVGIKDEGIYYLIGLLSGLFIGATLEGEFIWVPILGVVGLLFAALFLTVFVKGRADV